MLIAHAPAGYLVGVAAHARWPFVGMAAAGLLGGLAPDLDLIPYRLGLLEGHHRLSLTHWPVVWLGLLALAALLRHPLALTFAASGLVHCGLDATMAPLYWAAPFHWQPVELVEVPGGWDPYWLGFVFWWTFLPEIAIWAAAIAVWRRRSARRRARGAMVS